MGGAVTNITAVMHGLAKYDPDVVQGSVIDRTEVDRQIERYRAIPADGRRQIVGLQPKRAEVILAGACIVRTIMDKLGKSSLSVSDRGLRHGLLDRPIRRPAGPDHAGELIAADAIIRRHALSWLRGAAWPRARAPTGSWPAGRRRARPRPRPERP